MVHRRQIDGEPVVFGNQGDLWNNAMTWFDHDTGSIWSQVTGEAILGPRSGETLELLPSTLTTWDDWQRQFPDTVALDAFARQNRFTLDDLAVVVALDDDSIAIPMPALAEVGVVEVTVAGHEGVVVLANGGQRAVAFSRVVDGRVRGLDLVDGRLVDAATDESWDPRRGLAGGEYPSLEILPSFSSFPSDYAVFFPDGRVWTPEALVPAAAFN